ncbi:MAG: hypothetical protein WAQ33_16710 [Gaiellaceae bacterium]
MAAKAPEPAERTGEPDSAQRVLYLEQIERRTQIVVLAAERLGPLRLVLEAIGVRRLREPEEVLRVATPKGGLLTGRREPLDCELTDRLKDLKAFGCQMRRGGAA